MIQKIYDTKKIVYIYIVLFLINCSALQNNRPRGIHYVWKKYDTLEKISKQYQVSITTIRRENDIYEPEDLVPGMKIFIPHAKLKKAPKKIYSSKRYSHTLLWPAKGTISSGFGKRHGKMHYGIDLTRDGGRKVIAAANGVIEFSGRRGGFGNTIIINHGKGLKTLYAHNQTIYVKKGKRVKKGQLIAKMGSTGRSTGIHLHFEVHLNGVPKNPLRFLRIR